jgi:pimeloyl-ACP methyl ester carboxylesterase
MTRSWYYGPRRVPQAFPPSYVRLRVLPLVPPMLANAAMTLIAEAPVLPEDLREQARRRSESAGARILEDSQRLFFDEPGLDTLLIRSVSSLSRRVTQAGRAYLGARVGLGLDRDGRAAAMLRLVPTRGYDALMTSALAIGTALGHFRGGAVHAQAFFDSIAAGGPASAAPGPNLPLPAGHPVPAVRRFGAPRSLGDMAADIDDLYFAMAYGQAVKVTRVGPSGRDAPRAGRGRRWLVSITGTDHWDLDSTPNPSDLESNIREVLNAPSAARVGVVRALHEAMRADGVPADQWSAEPVLAVGHSQGGMVATALAAADPSDAGVKMVGVLTMGTPSRRLRIRDDVAMLAVAHDQDVVPAIDGTPARAPDRRVMVGRRLVRPRQGPLYYAHSSATYTETVRHIERRSQVAPWGRVDRTVEELRSHLPRGDEPTRVLLFDVWQDLLEPRRGSTWRTYVELDRPEWQPAEFAEDWSPNPLVPRSLPRVPSVIEELHGAVTGAVGAVAGVSQRVPSRGEGAGSGGEGAAADGTAPDGRDDGHDDQGRGADALLGEER